VAETGVGGAGDWEGGVVFALFCSGGPRAQADFDGRGFLDVEAVADLLILREVRQCFRMESENNKSRSTRIRYNENNT